MKNEISIEDYKKSVKKKGGTKMRDEFFANLEYFCKTNDITYCFEYKFLSARKFKFDMVLLVSDKNHEFDIAIEWEGIMSKYSYHTEVKGYTANCTKYNLAAINGYKVLRYTVLNKDEAISDIKKLLE
jgi:hypothetical protein